MEQQEEVRPLLLVDGPWLLYRSFFGVPDTIKNADGEPVNALLGSTTSLIDLVGQRNPRAVVVCFGPDAAEYRVESYSEYHAKRPPMPGELDAQWVKAPVIFSAFGWYIANTPDLEADDVLHSFALAESEAGGETLIFTADRDMFQCVNDQVHLLMPPAKGERTLREVDTEGVIERYGIKPDQVTDFIALRGDPSDGLPGAPGIGTKTAAQLLQKHGTLEATLAAAIRERPGVRKSLIENADQLRVFKDIATLRSMEVERPPDTETDWRGGGNAVGEYGMSALSGRLLSDDFDPCA
jgi:DNA polymerase-1